MNSAASILLISSSTIHGSGYLDHAETEIRDLLGPVRVVHFVPFALRDRDGYAAAARTRFQAMGYGLISLHDAVDPLLAIKQAEAVFIGGGNTFRLLKALYDIEILRVIRERVAEGMPYIGSSAGINVAGPTIKTTNDMPIVEPSSFEALGLVSFQLNPHYVDPDPTSTHMGETREERILQFLEENNTPVVGLREGAMIRVQDGEQVLKGTSSARIFRRGLDPVEAFPGDHLSQFL